MQTDSQRRQSLQNVGALLMYLRPGTDLFKNPISKAVLDDHRALPDDPRRRRNDANTRECPDVVGGSDAGPHGRQNEPPDDKRVTAGIGKTVGIDKVTSKTNKLTAEKATEDLLSLMTRGNMIHGGTASFIGFVNGEGSISVGKTLMEKARKSIHVSAYTYGNDGIHDSLMACSQKGFKNTFVHGL